MNTTEQRLSKILVDPGSSGAYAWAAWSAWRGDPKQFAQIVRRARRELIERDHEPRCSIEVVVLGDSEVFDSPDDFLEHVSPQALAKFSAIRAAVGDGTISVSLTMARRSVDQPFPAYRGVLLEVRALDELKAGAVDQIRATLLPSVSRGQFRLTTEPRKGGPDDDIAKTLNSLDGSRGGSVFLALSPLLGASLVLTLLALGVVHQVSLLEVALFGFGLALLFVFTLVAVPRSMDPLFPGVDIADTTPGRRLVRRLGALPLVPLGTFLAKELFEKQ